jgi:predicted nuclease with TOPRIM domain
VEYQIAQLRIAIERLRKELLQLGENKPLTDPEVVKLSQRLDRLLNEYNREAM